MFPLKYRLLSCTKLVQSVYSVIQPNQKEIRATPCNPSNPCTVFFNSVTASLSATTTTFGLVFFLHRTTTKMLLFPNPEYIAHSPIAAWTILRLPSHMRVSWQCVNHIR